MTDVEMTVNASRPTDRLTTFVHACLFVFGFSLIFVIGWGGAATLLGQTFITYKTLLAQIGGAVIILFGLSTLGLFRMPGMYYSDTRPQFSPGGKSTGWLASIGMGIFFAAGWTPCIGTTLGAILTLGFSQPNATQAMVLTSGYALGLGIPFLLLGTWCRSSIPISGTLSPPYAHNSNNQWLIPDRPGRDSTFRQNDGDRDLGTEKWLVFRPASGCSRFTNLPGGSGSRPDFVCLAMCITPGSRLPGLPQRQDQLFQIVLIQSQLPDRQGSRIDLAPNS